MARTLTKEEISELPLSNAEARLVDERLEEHRRNPEEGMSLDEFLSELSSKP